MISAHKQRVPRHMLKQRSIKHKNQIAQLYYEGIKPFISQLPKDPSEQLVIKYPLEHTRDSLRYHWKKELNALFNNDPPYLLSFTLIPDFTQLTISYIAQEAPPSAYKIQVTEREAGHEAGREASPVVTTPIIVQACDPHQEERKRNAELLFGGTKKALFQLLEKECYRRKEAGMDEEVNQTILVAQGYILTPEAIEEYLNGTRPLPPLPPPMQSPSSMSKFGQTPAEREAPSSEATPPIEEDAGCKLDESEQELLSLLDESNESNEEGEEAPDA